MSRPDPRWSIFLSGGLLLLVGVAVVTLQLGSRREAATEASVRRYAAAIERLDLDAAVAEIAPDRRVEWRPWIEGQLGNIYEIRGVAVRSTALWQRAIERLPGGPVEVTVVMDVNRGYPDFSYQPTTRVPVDVVDGRPYLGAPLLATP